MTAASGDDGHAGEDDGAANGGADANGDDGAANGDADANGDDGAANGDADANGDAADRPPWPPASRSWIRCRRWTPAAALTWTGGLSAELFDSEEARAGMVAYLDGRDPPWARSD